MNSFPVSSLLRMPQRRKEIVVSILVISVAALAAVLPFLYFGIPSGHDFEFHLNSWIEVLGHWKQGVVYPHWAALAHYGYGEARFIFYPPFSWTLGAVLGAVLPGRLVPAAYIWLVLTLAGVSMFFTARRWLSTRDAAIAGLVYALNPYHLVIVYWRSAMAELLAAVYLPLLFGYALQLKDRGRNMVPVLALLIAAGWLTNVPSAVMMNYSLALLATWVAISTRNWKVLLWAGLAVMLGAAMGAIYLVPTWHQQGWVNLSQVFAAGVSPQENFLFSSIADIDHNRFNSLVSIVAVSEMFLLFFIFAWGWRRQRAGESWIPMLAWLVFSTVLMLKITSPLWTHFPELRYVQLPWRWLLCLNVVFALALLMSFKRWWSRLVLCLLALLPVVIVWNRIQPPWWDSGDDVQEMADNQHEGIGNEGTDEYVPVGVDPYDANKDAPLARVDDDPSADVRVNDWNAERRSVSVSTTRPGKLILKTFDYPSWKTSLNGTRVAHEAIPNTGEITVDVPAGHSIVALNFVEGSDRLIGAIISLLALAGTEALYIRSRSPVALESTLG